MPRAPLDGKALFRQIPSAESRIDLVHRFPPDAPLELMTDQYSGSGICIGDVDGDGLPDIYITNYDRGNRLYRNLANFRFEDVTRRAGVSGEGRWSGGATFVDVDNDADLDLYVCVFNSPNLLYINQGNGVFVEEARERGLDYAGASVMMAFADVDQDGDLDGYLVTHRMNTHPQAALPRSTQEAFQRGIIERTQDGVRVQDPYRELFQLMDRGEGRLTLVIAGQQDYLYLNDGTGRFAVANSQAGISGYGIGLAATWWDYNEDGAPDLYVSNDYKGADQLYHNHGNGTFTEVAKATLPHLPWFSMGSATADINNDGRIDLLATDMSGTDHVKQKMAMGDMEKDRWFLRVADPPQYMRNALYLNTGSVPMMEVAYLTGVANTDWTWSPLFGDLDNDGWVDLFVSNGMSRDFMDSDLIQQITSKQDAGWLQQPIRKERNLAFRNLGDLRLVDVASIWGLDQMSASYGAALADLDGDGDLDLIVTNFDEPVSLYRNLGSQHKILTVRLIGSQSNHWGIGARIQLQSKSGTQVRYLNSCQGFMSASELMVHFGLGDDDRAERLTVHWPSGAVQQFSDLPAGHRYVITEHAQPRSVGDPISSQRTWFRRWEPFPQMNHREAAFDDFQQQPLLPAKLSQQGPGLAVADINGDESEEVFLSGAAGQSSQMADVRSAQIRPLAEGRDAELEQLGALFFDVDGDGDRDLYAVSGGVECTAASELLQDRLYLNDGAGRFQESEHALPRDRDSGSCVAAADFDRDGDLDLFVGGRVVPGRYPISPASRILRNEDGRLTLAHDALPDAPELNRITSALWSDADGDGWLDLLVTQQWGPVHFLKNERGILRNATSDSGLAEYRGWWNGIAAGDLDRDGDLDYVVTNRGLNTKYQASVDSPSLLFYGDFEGRGRMHLVEAEYERNVLYPGRGRSCTTAAMPLLGSRFTTFRDFASATLLDIYPEQRLNGALRLEVNTLSSSILLNDGLGHFQLRPLPRLAQASPASGVAVIDVDGDGNLDIYLVHNDYSPQPETGRMDGGLSLLLRGDGQANFSPVWPATSGLIVPGDAQSLVVSDLDDDSRPDFLVGVNNQTCLAFENRSGATRDFLKVLLRGAQQGNRAAIGGRVTLTTSDGKRQTAELRAGGGYLSQSTNAMFFGLGGQSAASISVRWPDGRVSEHAVAGNPRRVVVTQDE